LEDEKRMTPEPEVLEPSEPTLETLRSEGSVEDGKICGKMEDLTI